MSSGTKIDQGKLTSIAKGTTTRAQIEEMFGPPMTLTIAPDGSGRRTGMWHYMESNTHVKGTSFIPFAGAFMGGAEGTGQNQQLQVVFNKSDVVEDFVYSGGKTNTDVGGNPWSTNVKSQTTADAPVAGH